jgi:AmmeMemoRadiSam system protein B
MSPPPRPRLVPLEPKAVDLEDGSKAVALRDPYGALEGLALVTPAAYWVLAHFDGCRTLGEVHQVLERAGLEVRLADIERVAEQAFAAGLVHGPTYDAARAAAVAEFRARPRPPACAGGSYPADEGELRGVLDSFYKSAAGPGPRDPCSSAGRDVGLLVAPHIDFQRGGATYAHAYAALEGCEADLYLVFGTAHASPPRLFTLTRQDYETPLGPVPTDRAVVDALAEELGEEEVFADELVHKAEHSCEFQMVWLRWVLGDRPFRAVPVLCSSISYLQEPERETSRFFEALARAASGMKVCCIAGADLAHVGPLYGDPHPPSARDLASLGDQDRRTLAFLEAADACGFYRDGIVDDARRRLCGVAPIFAARRASGRGARLLHYDQWTDGTDMVSFAAAAG